MAMKSLGDSRLDAPGGGNRKKWYEKVTLLKFNDGEATHIRVVGGFFHQRRHWLKSQKGKPFPLFCPNWNPETEEDEDNGCAACLEDKLKPQDVLIFNAIDRGEQELGSNDFIKVAVLPPSAYGQLSKIKKMKKGKDPEDPKSGYDIAIFYDSKAKTAAQTYNLQGGDNTPLEKSERKAALFPIDELCLADSPQDVKDAVKSMRAGGWLDDEDDEDDNKSKKKKNKRDEDDSKPVKKGAKKRVEEDDDDEDEDEDEDDYDNDDDEDEKPKSKSKSKPKSKAKSKFDDDDDDDDDDEDDEDEKPKSKSKAKPKSKSKFDDDDDDDDDEEEKPKSKSKTKSKAKSRFDDDEDDEVEEEKPKSKNKSKSRFDDDEDEKPKSKSKAKSRFDEDEEEDEKPKRRSIDRDDRSSSRGRERRASPSKSSRDSDDDDDDDEPEDSVKRSGTILNKKGLPLCMAPKGPGYNGSPACVRCAFVDKCVENSG